MALGVLPTSAPHLLVRWSEPLTWANVTMERFPRAKALRMVLVLGRAC